MSVGRGQSRSPSPRSLRRALSSAPQVRSAATCAWLGRAPLGGGWGLVRASSCSACHVRAAAPGRGVRWCQLVSVGVSWCQLMSVDVSWLCGAGRAGSARTVLGRVHRHPLGVDRSLALRELARTGAGLLRRAPATGVGGW
jgi:hypothetical protein